MTEPASANALTMSLEDYLETILELVRLHKTARVKDIAKARGVRSASVTPALRRLADLGLIRYERREYIDLTPDGEREARRVFSRHQLLTRFFHEVLGMPEGAAVADACAMEHSLSAMGMDHLVRLFEFLQLCPAGRDLLGKLGTCATVQGPPAECQASCSLRRAHAAHKETVMKSVDKLRPGERGRVAQVQGRGAVRQRLLDMGVLPDAVVEMERVAPAGDPVWIKLQGYQLSLRVKEAAMVVVAVF